MYENDQKNIKKERKERKRIKRRGYYLHIIKRKVNKKKKKNQKRCFDFVGGHGL